jgi:hypothetical protein
MRRQTPKEKLIVLYQEMSDLTAPCCGRDCGYSKYRCCSPEYCEMAIQIAKEEWNTDLVRTDHPTLPLMDEKGCTVAPHFRPLCTLHTCDVNAFGFKKHDPGGVWTRKYFKIRNKIDRIEAKLALARSISQDGRVQEDIHGGT